MAGIGLTLAAPQTGLRVHVGRSHSTATLTCARSDSTLDHVFAPSDRFTFTPQSTVTKCVSTVT
jgi:hypothetical protein